MIFNATVKKNVRGLRGVGAVVAAMVFLVGIAITVPIASKQQNLAESRFYQTSCAVERWQRHEPLKPLAGSPGYIDLSASGCPGNLSAIAASNVMAFNVNKTRPTSETLFATCWFGLFLSIASAAFAYLAFCSANERREIAVFAQDASCAIPD
ncbi:hypothetical protein L6654_41535 [Bradyrhizobium sp. WYCCWR 13023]|uniref:Uncharacterized protein n=1 Tax=Bradyrhizobium zhengyangense TaxID=2911009 RepID=A0A9X1UD08_9BRAD|nr:hypothetical protein [Bradyrhizobium zhengyangense]MCG2633046.1 hypothetical protein [Bradyrhizobium zhengyangense]